MNVNLGVMLDVTFQDGTLVAKTLKELHTQVGLLLKSFRPAFQYRLIE